jgi:hypothetical protein
MALAKLPIVITIVGWVLTFITLLMLGFAAFTEAGILPRQPKDTRQASNPNPTVMRNGKEVLLKYCETCQIYRPPRTVHCRACDNCIKEFDHHCPWVSNCVGERNYKYFILFVFSAAILEVYVGVCIIYVLATETAASSFQEAVMGNAAVFIELIFLVLNAWCLGGLVGYHCCVLMAEGQTTNEHLKGIGASQGNLLSNWKRMLCTPIPPSLIKLSRPLRATPQHDDVEKGEKRDEIKQEENEEEETERVAEHDALIIGVTSSATPSLQRAHSLRSQSR